MRGAVFASLLTVVSAAAAMAASADEADMSEAVRKSIVRKPFVVYPYEARRQRLAGSGIVRVDIDRTGRVTATRMEKSTGHSILDNAATSAFQQARFKPDTPSPVHLPISFALADSGTLANLEAESIDRSLARFLGRGTVLRAPIPSYPNPDHWTSKDGKGVYELHVDKRGKVENVKILKSSGDATFDRITEKTLRKWKLRRGPMVVELPLGFQLTPGKFSVGVGR